MDTPEESVAMVEPCARCNRRAPAATDVDATYGELAPQIRARICEDCWREWQGAEVMVINELRLNFMDPDSLPTLYKHLREFLCLAE